MAYTFRRNRVNSLNTTRKAKFSSDGSDLKATVTFPSLIYTENKLIVVMFRVKARYRGQIMKLVLKCGRIRAKWANRNITLYFTCTVLWKSLWHCGKISGVIAVSSRQVSEWHSDIIKKGSSIVCLSNVDVIQRPSQYSSEFEKKIAYQISFCER